MPKKAATKDDERKNKNAKHKDEKRKRAKRINKASRRAAQTNLLARILPRLFITIKPKKKIAESAQKSGKNAVPSYYSHIIESEQSKINAKRPFCACIVGALLQ